MLIKLEEFLTRYDMVAPGDTVTCAVSGGADSMALLWAMYLLKDKLKIHLRAAHFNHGLRGAESDGDAAFVRDFCEGYGIELTVGQGNVTAGKKGLEAAARDARYGFLESQPGKIATAHTANDNAETVLLHLVRGTGLKGLGAIAPVRGRIIRPMLGVTRSQVIDFLVEYHIPFREDSSNAGDAFLRNRLRHNVMPLLEAENPKIAENLSTMALRLRQDEELLSDLAARGEPYTIEELRMMHSAQRNRALERFLKENGVREPEAEHIALAEALVFSDKPSAQAHFPGGVTVRRSYNTLAAGQNPQPLDTVVLPCPGTVELPPYRVICQPAQSCVNDENTYTVRISGKVLLRCRRSGDEIRLSGGTKSLKKLFIDRKIPAAQRLRIPVIADDEGVLAVGSVGVNLDRAAQSLPAWQIHIERI